MTLKELIFGRWGIVKVEHGYRCCITLRWKKPFVYNGDTPQTRLIEINLKSRKSRVRYFDGHLSKDDIMGLCVDDKLRHVYERTIDELKKENEELRDRLAYFEARETDIEMDERLIKVLKKLGE